MRIRDLELKDAPLMLEWMHDKEVVESMRCRFEEKTINDCEAFIRDSWNKGGDIHFAIASDEDEYMGTVSLKCIDRENNSAELGIIVRRAAMRRGYAWFALEEILRVAFDEHNLFNVYWCVSRKNVRAVRFYDKHNFHEAVDISEIILERYKGIDNLKWYSVLKGDVLDERETVAGCNIVHIRTVPTVDAGELSYMEGNIDVPFEFKRMYCISKVPEGTRRGFHAHRTLKQMLFCPYGRIQLVLENKNGREEIELSDPSIGVVIEEPTWREMVWIQKDSVLCVVASDYYKAEDYIRDYQEFKRIISD